MGAVAVRMRRGYLAVVTMAVATATMVPGVAFAAGSGGSGGGVVRAATSAHAATKLVSSGASGVSRSFSSPASNSHRIGALAKDAATDTAHGAQVSATGGATIYATVAPCSGTGAGTPAAPYCSVQAAVNAASPGDTIDVSGGGYLSGSPVTITTSDLTITGIQAGNDLPGIAMEPQTPGLSALTLDGASDVTVSGLELQGDEAPAVQIVDSTGVTIDSSFVELFPVGLDGQPVISVDGASSGVTVSRSLVSPGSATSAGPGIALASGASNIVLADDALAATGISATGVNGLDIVNDTIQRACTGGIGIASSSDVAIENNILEDTDQGTDYAVGGTPSDCRSGGDGWAPDITVDSASASATTADYNDFYAPSADDTDPYSWGGTAYSGLAAFQSGTSQGAHDTNDTVIGYNDGNLYGGYAAVALLPQPYEAADSSANPDAPGMLTTDLFGSSPFNTRGAVQYTSPNAKLAVTLTATQTAAYTIQLAMAITTAPSMDLTETINWGDGTTTTLANGGYVPTPPTHVYPATGDYTVTVTTTDTVDDKVVSSIPVSVVDIDPGISVQLSATNNAPLSGSISVTVPQSAQFGALPLTEDIAWGDGTTSTEHGSAGTASAWQHTYAAIGTYAITVTVNDGEDTATSSTQVDIVDPFPGLDTGLSLSASDGGALGVGLGIDTPSTTTSYNVYLAETISWGDGTSTTNLGVIDGAIGGGLHTYAHAGSYTITVTASDGYGDSATNSIAVTTAGSDYTPMNPARILDTRKGLGAEEAPVGADKTLVLKVGGANGIPTGITAVALNLTVTDAKANGYITAYYDGDPTRPDVSNVNFGAGRNVANFAVVSVGPDGEIDLYNGSGATVDLVADVSGYFSQTTSDGYTSLGTPTRFLDTSTATGGHPSPVAAGSTVTLAVGGEHGVPTGVSAIAANITVANVTGNGYVSAWPAGTGQPAVSNVNFTTGEVLANAAIIRVGSNGDIDLAYNGAGSIRLIVDVYGYYSGNGASVYVPLAPERIVDTRKGIGGYTGVLTGHTFYPETLPTNDVSELDGTQITGGVVNATVTGTTALGFLSVVPDNEIAPGEIAAPTTSNLDFGANATVPNLAFATPASDGIVDFVNASTGSLYLIVDLYGEFMDQ